MNTCTKLRALSQVVTLLRLSPLLPLALSNYLYGLTSVDLPSYVAGSWLGMLPGTIAYVTAGAPVAAKGICPLCTLKTCVHKNARYRPAAVMDVVMACTD